MPLIRVQSLTKLYRMGESVVHALDGVDLEIEQGEFVAITGASGSGKSTIMHLLGCLDRPTSGSIVFDGRDVSDLSDRELADIRNRQVGFVFQTFNLINRTDAVDNVGVPLFYARRANTRGPARKALERVGLGERGNHRPGELSGGERQRVAIARALVNNPVLLLADEPTGNLDTRTGQQIMEVFRSLNDQGMTVVIVTHERDVALQAKRIVAMRDGKIVSDELTEDILRQDGETPGSAAQPPPVAAVATARPLPRAGVATPQPAAVAALGPEPVPELPVRKVRGANLALVLGILAVSMVLVCIGAGAVVNIMHPELAKMQPGQTPPRIPPSAIVGWAAALLAFIGSIVLGIVAIIYGRSVLRRVREEPAVWRGIWRARIGVILGWLGALALPLMFIVQVVVFVAGAR